MTKHGVKLTLGVSRPKRTTMTTSMGLIDDQLKSQTQ